MCVLCKMVRSVKMMVIDVVGGVEMNGVKIKTVQKIQSNILETFGESCVFKLCKSFIKYLILLKIMYNNFTNTLIYNHFHILNTSTLFICNNHTNILDPHYPQSFTFTPPPLSPIQFFFFSSNFKTTPLNYFYLILFFFFFLQITHIYSNFLYNAIYILCLLFVLLYVYSFVITHFRGVYGYSNICYIAATFTRCTLYDA